MGYFKWFIRLRFLILKNSLWKDVKTAGRTLAISAAVVISQIVLTSIIYRNIFSRMAPVYELGKSLLSLFFLVAVVWIYLISFTQSISGFLRNFYKSPDMNYLITIPVPFDQVFLFKFFEHVIGSSRSMLFLFFPFLTALGIWVNAPLIYYLAIIPLYILISVIPCAIGAVVAMAGLKLLPAKVFNIITPALAFLVNVGFAVLFTRIQGISPVYLARILDFLERPWVSSLIPVTAGIRVLSSAAGGEGALLSALFLILATLIIMAAALLLSRKLFIAGWVKSQPVAGPAVNKKDTVSGKSRKSRDNVIVEWIKTEWKMALRNHDMLIGAVFMLFFFLFAVFSFTYGGFFADDPLIGVFILIAVASVFNIIAVSILFIPAEISVDKNLWKNRYWLLKILPLGGEKVFSIQCNMFFIPGFIISLAGIVVYSVFNSLGIHQFWPSILVLFFILYGSCSLQVSVELLSLTAFFESNAFFGNLITIILPALYGTLSAGVIALFLAQDLVAGIAVISGISAVLSWPVVIVLPVLTVISTFLLSRLMFIRVWQKLEI